MFSLIRPLDTRITFDDRPFHLGETVDITVELYPKGDVEVREGRMELVCEGRYDAIYTIMVPDRRIMRSRGMRAYFGKRASPYAAQMTPKQIVEKRNESYVHSSVVFLNHTRLPSDVPERHDVRLEIAPHPSAYIPEAQVRWRLVAAIDVVYGLDVNKKWTVAVTLPNESQANDRSDG